MVDELQIYEKDGIFHNIVKASTIMDGRYAAIYDTGDLNTNNVLTGLDPAKYKLPLVVCLPPYSIVKSVEASASDMGETYSWTLYFLAGTFFTGDNKIKTPDPLTNTSLHTARQDAFDMKRVALSFIRALEKLERNSRGSQFEITSPVRISKIIKGGTGNLSGVSISFQMFVSFGVCDLFTDINLSNNDLKNFFADLPVHAPHLH